MSTDDAYSSKRRWSHSSPTAIAQGRDRLTSKSQPIGVRPEVPHARRPICAQDVRTDSYSARHVGTACAPASLGWVNGSAANLGPTGTERTRCVRTSWQLGWQLVCWPYGRPWRRSWLEMTGSDPGHAKRVVTDRRADACCHRVPTDPSATRLVAPWVDLTGRGDVPTHGAEQPSSAVLADAGRLGKVYQSLTFVCIPSPPCASTNPCLNALPTSLWPRQWIIVAWPSLRLRSRRRKP